MFEVEPDPDTSAPAEAGPDARAPLFFLSYARATRLQQGPIKSNDPNLRVKQLFTDLSNHVNNLVYREPGADPGFMDQTMTGGEQWQRELLHAVGTCQVFVALLSPKYLHSEYCALEWNAFVERPLTRRDKALDIYETSVIPVIWTPFTREPVPPAVNKLQRFAPKRLPDDDLSQQYTEEGLYGLLSLGAEGTDGIILRLAQHIVDLAWNNQVQPQVLPDTKSISRTFR